MSKLLMSWLDKNEPLAEARLVLMSGISFSTIQSIRQGKYKSSLRTSTIVKLAESIGVSPTDLMADIIACEKEKQIGQKKYE